MPISFDFAQLATVVKETFEPSFYQTFEANSFFMRMIEEAGAKETYVEKDITWKVYVSGNPAAGSYREDGTLGLSRTDLGPRFSTARLHWRLNKVPIKVSGLAQAVSQSKSAIIDAVGENTADGLRMLQKNMNRQMLSDGAGNLNGVDTTLDASGADITGVQAMWDDGSGVPIYGGINRNVNTFWRSFVLKSTGATLRPITEELMHQILNEIEGVREGSVTDITSSLGVFTQLGLLLGQDRRFNFGGSETPKYRGGFRTLFFNDKEVTGIPLYEKNRMDFFDRDLLKFKVLLDFTIEARDAGDQDAVTMFAKTYSQMQYKNCWQSASIRHIQE